MLDTVNSQELEQERIRLARCMRMASGDLGVALKSEIQRLAGGRPADQEIARKHELACLRMASDCMELVGDIREPKLQRRFLELARQVTAAAEPQQQQSRQPLLARIEQLIDQVFIYSTVAGQQIAHEECGEFRLAVKDREQCGLRDGGNDAIFQRHGCGDPQRVAVQATLAEELPGLEDPDHRFLALLGQHVCKYDVQQRAYI